MEVHDLAGYYMGDVEGVFPPFGQILLLVDAMGNYVSYLRDLGLLGRSTEAPLILFGKGRLEFADGQYWAVETERDGLRGEFGRAGIEYPARDGSLLLHLHWGKTRYFPSFDGRGRLWRLCGLPGGRLVPPCPG